MATTPKHFFQCPQFTLFFNVIHIAQFPYIRAECWSFFLNFEFIFVMSLNIQPIKKSVVVFLHRNPSDLKTSTGPSWNLTTIFLLLTALSHLGCLARHLTVVYATVYWQLACSGSVRIWSFQTFTRRPGSPWIPPEAFQKVQEEAESQNTHRFRILHAIIRVLLSFLTNTLFFFYSKG